MKIMFKYLIMLVMLLALVIPANAATTNITVTAGSTNIISTTGWNISSVKLTVGANGGSPVVYLYDNNAANNKYTNDAYVSYVTVATNITSVITNSAGFLQTNSYPGQFTYAVNNAANTNTLPAIATLTANANSSQTVTGNLVTGKGLVYAAPASSAATNCILTIVYRPAYTSP